MLNNITIITDPGVDDLVALALLDKLSHNKKHSLISTFGNVALNSTEQNAKEFISFVSPHWLYFRGSEVPVLGKRTIPWGDSFHGLDGTWGVHINNHHSVKVLNDYPVNKTIVSLGPLTELTKLQRKISLDTVILMGGAFIVKGNETEYSEFNIASDPEAAYTFFTTLNNIKVKIVPLDVTNKIKWSLEQVKSIPESNEVNVWLKKLLMTWFANYRKGKAQYFELFDPLTIFLFFYPKHANWKKSGVLIKVDGKERGRTIFSEKGKICEVALEIINPDEVANQIYRLLFL